MDPPASSADQPRRTRRQALLYDQAGVRERTVDNHRFVVPAGRGRQQATFRLQLFTAIGLRPIAVITQVVPAEGAGPVNHAQRYAETIWRQLLPAEPRPPIVIGHMITDYADVAETRDLGWLPIDFEVADRVQFSLRWPIWGGRIDAAALEYLVGQPVDPSRGTFTPSRPARRRWWHRQG